LRFTDAISENGFAAILSGMFFTFSQGLEIILLTFKMERRSG
jgi:hypothetical protein